MERLLPFRALLFDLDGVITDTRSIHFNAWKKLFDKFLSEKGRSEVFNEEDYMLYLDGRPREDGIRSFLKAHAVSVSDDEFTDLVTSKNEIYKKLLNQTDLKTYPDFLKLFDLLKSRDIKTAVVSSSENCRLILTRLHLEHEFDCIFDGKDGKRLKLNGKPAPDYFQEAAGILGLRAEECAVVEDALNGVMAGKNGNFKTVYGISRKGSDYLNELKNAGADKPIKELTEIINPPNALLSWDEFSALTGSKDLAIFLDFDGTLSEIVPRHQDASLRPEAKNVLTDLSRSVKLAIISGRDRTDVKDRVGVDDIFYAGSHGFDMSGPGCFRYHLDDLDPVLKELSEATLSANNLFTREEGIQIEKKAFGTAIHYRLAPTGIETSLKAEIEELLTNFPKLKLKEGKKVFELVPDVEWGKGKAVEKLMDVLGLDPRSTLPLYIGDDTTDEDAFSALEGKGIGIRVDDDEQSETHADFCLKNPEEVIGFLNCVLKEYGGDQKRWRIGT